jgi:hypothetical protein
MSDEAIDIPMGKVLLQCGDNELVGCDVANEKTELTRLPNDVGGIRLRLGRLGAGKKVLVQLKEVTICSRAEDTKHIRIVIPSNVVDVKAELTQY